MTPRTRAPRLAVGIVVSLALMAVAAGCGAQPSTDIASGDTGTGTGQVGEAPAGGGQDVGPAPTPLPTPPADEEPVTTPPPTLNPGVVLTINPNLLLPWPASPDCISYDPSVASVKYTPSKTLWQVIAGNSILIAFKRDVDAQAGLALVKAYKKLCFIGRDNTRADRQRYIMSYWMDPVGTAPAITNPDCLPHQGNQLTVVNAGTVGWRVEGGSEAIALFDTKADADNAVLVMKHYNRHCYIGRGYTGSDRLNYITDWFATV